MGSNARGGIDFTDGAATGSKYGVKTNMGDKPVNYVSWFDAARVSNWLMNGATSSSSTEIGAYSLIGGQISGTAPAVTSDAAFYVPTEDQWYKAAYYKGGGTNEGYWDYATQSDVAPQTVTADPAGDGSAGNTGNFANFRLSAQWNSQNGNVTTVGTNGGPGAYETFDMTGNLWEWNDLTGTDGLSRGLRGGSWYSTSVNASSSYNLSSYDPAYEDLDIGFRLASPVSGPSGVPEIDPNGLSAVIGLLVGGLGLLERRRSR
jgi:formylglycine-generating enzyme required for sulfatase activity